MATDDSNIIADMDSLLTVIKDSSPVFGDENLMTNTDTPNTNSCDLSNSEYYINRELS